MKLIILFLVSLFLYLSLTVNEVACQDPITLTIIGAVVTGLSYYLSKDSEVNESIKHYVKQTGKYVCVKIGYCEGCEDYWIPGNMAALEYDLQANIFGQPLALDIVLGAMKQHLRKGHEPERALMLSFHGSPGTGKNFVSQKILKNMFRNGVNTDFLHVFRSSIDFPLQSHIEEYKRQIANKVKDKVYECKRSVFVFDEVEKMPNGILDVLSSIVKAGKYSDKLDFRRTIFILLSNIGSEALYLETLNTIQNGGRREEMDVNKLMKSLVFASFNVDGGLKNTGLVKSMSISHYVPFLPLEREHVVLCLKKAVAHMRQEISDVLIEQVLEELTFGPKNFELLAYAGCKGVVEKASVLIERETSKRRKSGL